MAENVIDYGRTKIKAEAFIGAGQPEPASIVNADIAANAAIATTKLADGTELTALVAAETELTALAESDLVTAIAAPAEYSEVAADIAAALVAAGLMKADV